MRTSKERTPVQREVQVLRTSRETNETQRQVQAKNIIPGGRLQTARHTLSSSERALANRCKKLQSITRLADKEREQQIQMNQNTHTHKLQIIICRTYSLANGCEAETKDEHVPKSRNQRDAIFT